MLRLTTFLLASAIGLSGCNQPPGPTPAGGQRALVIVDMQYDFLPGGSLATAGGDEIIETINNLQSHFDLVVATQDWHPPNHGSFASNHQGHEIGERIDLHGLQQVLWPDHAVQGSHGAALAAELDQ